jgi:hypothetical protein
MESERPYPAKYAIGLLVVMGFHMVFNAYSLLDYPYEVPGYDIKGTYILVLFCGVAAWEFIEAISLYRGSCLFHKLAVISSVVLLIAISIGAYKQEVISYDIWFHSILSLAVLIILLFPSVRNHYRGWTLGPPSDTQPAA